VDEDEHGALLRCEAGEASLELVPQGQLALAVARGRFVGGRELDLRQPASPVASYPREAGPNQELSEPGLEAVRISEAREGAPRFDERVLDRILDRAVSSENAT